MSPEFELSRLL